MEEGIKMLKKKYAYVNFKQAWSLQKQKQKQTKNKTPFIQLKQTRTSLPSRCGAGAETLRLGRKAFWKWFSREVRLCFVYLHQTAALASCLCSCSPYRPLMGSCRPEHFYQMLNLGTWCLCLCLLRVLTEGVNPSTLHKGRVSAVFPPSVLLPEESYLFLSFPSACPSRSSDWLPTRRISQHFWPSCAPLARLVL